MVYKFKRIFILSSKLGDGKKHFYTCGVNPEIAKMYMKQKYIKDLNLQIKNNAAYVIMTNRTLLSKKKKITNCYDEYDFENVHQIKRNGIILSAIKKNKNE